MKTFFAILLISMLAFAACTGNENVEQNNNANRGSDEQNQAPVQNQEENQEQEVGIGAFEEIQKYFTDKNSIEFMVEYQMNTKANGQEFSGTMTQYYKGANRMRMDSESMGVESRVFMEGNKYTTCTQQNNDWMCFEISSEEATSESDNLQEDLESNTEEWNVKKIASRTIAGASATCYITSKDDDSVEYCFSKEGVPLYIKTEGKESGVTFMSELTATDYSLSVSESVFEKPASSQSMEDYLANIPGYS